MSLRSKGAHTIYELRAIHATILECLTTNLKTITTSHEILSYGLID